MRKAIFVAFVAALFALSAGQVLALQTGTWDCMGYTITVTPDDPDNVNLGGSIVITKSDEYAEVSVEGRYWKEEGKRPDIVVDVAGTITTPDGQTDVARVFTFAPGPKKTVWNTVISWLESQIAN